ncbi:MAG: helix-turn-helix domain-containing protein [Verrucomicrobiales bacterium]|nr:helix-turn-helix domain-containing protein [Verrucomicrobiales bacterium]
MNSPASLIEAMSKEPMFDEFRQAFSRVTGMPLSLRPLNFQGPPHRGQCPENGFCALMAGAEATCANCLRTQQRLHEESRDGVALVRCQYGLQEAAVPVRLGHEAIGFLQTGQALERPPSEREFRQVVNRVEQTGARVASSALRRTFFETPVVSEVKLRSAVAMLKVFAEHLALLGNQIAIRSSNQDPGIVRRAKEFIDGHLHEPLPLARVAAAVHVSPYYFCKLFHRSGDMTFKEYVSRARVERAKQLLLDPNKRVSEACFEVGFNSLTSFNRVFHAVTGMTPTGFREQLPGSSRKEPEVPTGHS